MARLAEWEEHQTMAQERITELRETAQALRDSEDETAALEAEREIAAIEANLVAEMKRLSREDTNGL
eukprot:COSAG06_NODE_3437_length_5351_cov_8.940023_2_plen_67_part_00